MRDLLCNNQAETANKTSKGFKNKYGTKEPNLYLILYLSGSGKPSECEE